jgi:putative transcriptional regulator
MKNRVQLFRKAKHWTQADLASHVGVTRECVDAIEKGRFLPSIALAYNIAAALEQYVLEVFPPQAPFPKSSPRITVPGKQIHTALSRGISIHSGDLK